MGYRMVIWPVSSLRVANKRSKTLFAAIKRDGGTHKVIDQMQTRAELYEAIGTSQVRSAGCFHCSDDRPGRDAAEIRSRPHPLSHSRSLTEVGFDLN